jgi:hypothetical protein
MEDVHIWGEGLFWVNVLIHLLTGVVLLGALTHHLWLVIKGEVTTYARAVRRFSFWATVSYLVCLLWGLDTRRRWA